MRGTEGGSPSLPQRNLACLAAPAALKEQLATGRARRPPAQTMTMEIGQFSIILWGSKATQRKIGGGGAGEGPGLHIGCTHV